MSDTSYRYTISIPNNAGNADLIDKLQRMENGSRSRFTRAVMDDGFKHRDEMGIDRFYGVFFSDEAPTVAPTQKPRLKGLSKGENGKATPNQRSEKQLKGTHAVDKLAKNLDESLQL